MLTSATFPQSIGLPSTSGCTAADIQNYHLLHPLGAEFVQDSHKTWTIQNKPIYMPCIYAAMLTCNVVTYLNPSPAHANLSL